MGGAKIPPKFSVECEPEKQVLQPWDGCFSTAVALTHSQPVYDTGIYNVYCICRYPSIHTVDKSSESEQHTARTITQNPSCRRNNKEYRYDVSIASPRMINPYPLTCIQTLWLKAKLIGWVMSVTVLGKVVSDQNPLPCNHG